MNKKLDLTALVQPEFELTFPDGTKIFVMIPEEKLVERLIGAASELKAVKDSNDAMSIKALYDLAAEFLSNNSDGLQITAEDLRDKYKVKLIHLIFIYSDYIDFINEINNAKN